MIRSIPAHLFVLGLFLPGLCRAGEKRISSPTCLSAQKAEMPETPDLVIPGSPLRVGLCFLPENSHHEYVNRVQLKRGKQLLAEKEVITSGTVGRPSLDLDQATKHFVALATGTNEFCNGTLIFDLVRPRVAAHMDCPSDSHSCKVVEILDKECRAKVICKDNGGDNDPSAARKPDVIKILKICNR